jgi:hypothetical protein
MHFTDILQKGIEKEIQNKSERAMLDIESKC